MPSGLTVAADLALLWRYFSLEYELFRSVAGWVPRIASYDVKCTLVEHLHEDMRRTRALRERIGDFGVFAPEKQVDPGLANLVRHLLQAPFDGALVGAFYRVIKIEQAAAYRRHLATTLRLNDAPTVALLEDHLPKLDRQVAWARALLDGPALPLMLAQQVETFEQEIAGHLAALGGLFRVPGRAAAGAGVTGVTGGSSIAELEAALARSAMTPDEIAELTANARAEQGTKNEERGTKSGGSGESGRSSGEGNGHGAAGVPEYPAYVRPRVMALEPRFARQTADRLRDAPWESDILIAAAYTHFTELPVIDICAAIVYDGRDIVGLGADRGGDEVGEESALPEDPEERAKLEQAQEKYARAVQRAQEKRARGEGLGALARPANGGPAAVGEGPRSNGAPGAADAVQPAAGETTAAGAPRLASGTASTVSRQVQPAAGAPGRARRVQPANGGRSKRGAGRETSVRVALSPDRTTGQAPGQAAAAGQYELPFDFYCDFLRQTWDEVRHSRMGFERLQALGIDPYQVAIPLGHYAVWGNVHLRDRIASLTQVGEACSFKGKREWVAHAHERGEWLSALEHDFDMVDEKNHVRYGARWLPEILQRLGDPRTPEEVVQDADWTFRRRLNAIKRDLGEAWKEELGHRFLGCATQTSDVTLAPEIIA